MHLLSSKSRATCNEYYQLLVADKDYGAMRALALVDLYFLLTVICKRRDIDCDWLYARCREVEEMPDEMLDLWAREHYKSTIVTYGKTMQDILANPDETVGIFSHTRPIAKAFLKQIKVEFEDNTLMKSLFSDVLYENPKKEAPTWSLDAGITVKRNTNPKESTIEAWGLVDGQPTSKHYALLVYDDVVTKESVSNSDMIEKVLSSWELSLSLGAHGGRKRHVGTRYHFNDTYRTMMDRGTVTPRIHTATDDGKVDGNPVFLSRKVLAEKRRDMGPFTFGSQMLQNPLADAVQGFDKDWLHLSNSIRADQTWNRYLLCDPAGSKKKENDYTVMLIIGAAPDGNYYLLDGLRDRLNLTERTDKMFDMYEKWSPNAVGYEKYGKDSDIEHIEYVMEQRNFRFVIQPTGGSMSKEDRIRRLVPVFEQGRFWMPERLLFLDHEGKMRDFVHEFINDEFIAFPVSLHDDMLDCMARIFDIGAKFPKKRHVATPANAARVQPNRVKKAYNVLER